MQSIQTGAIRLAAGLAVCLSASLTSADPIEWINPNGGSWTDASNWNLLRAPGLDDDALIAVPGEFTVSFDVQQSTVSSLAITNPATTLTIHPGRTLRIAHELHNDGLILIDPTSAGPASRLTMLPGSTIQGTGTIRLNRRNSHTTTSAWLGAGTSTLSDPVLHTSGHTIDGFGRIEGSLINYGLIDANVTDEPLIIDSVVENHSVVRSSDGDMILYGTVWQYGDGVILAEQGGAGSLRVTVVRGGTMRADAGRTITLSSQSYLVGVTMFGDFEYFSIGTWSTTPRIASPGITNHGVIKTAADPNERTVDIRIVNHVAIDGDGILWLNNGSRLSTETGSVLEHGAEHTIKGYGRISGHFINHGTVISDTPGRDLTISNSTTTNHGVIASEGGGLNLHTATLSQGPSGVFMSGHGDCRISYGSTIEGGTIRSLPGTHFNRDIGGSTIASVNIDGTLVLQQNTTTNFRGDIENDGLVIVNPENSGNQAAIRIVDTCSIDGFGEIRLGGEGVRSAFIVEPGVDFTNGAGHSIVGFGRITGSFVNEGIIDADVPGQVLQVTGSTISNDGFLAATAGTLELSSGIYEGGPNGVILAAGGEVGIGGGSELRSLTFNTSHGGRIALWPGTTRLANASILGHVESSPGSTVLLEGSYLTNDGLLVVGLGSGSSSAVFEAQEDLVIQGGGEILLNRPGGSSQLATLTDVTVTVGENQTISGVGRLRGDFNLRGITAPGLGNSSVLQLLGNVRFEPTHRLRIRVSGPTTLPASHGRISVSPAFEFGGELDVEFVDGYTPALGDSFQISTGAYTGEFESLSISGSIPSGLTGSIRYEPTQVLLDIVDAPACIPDINGDGVVDADDFFEFLSLFAAGDLRADINNDGIIDADDFFEFLTLFAAGC
ncbi:MAG: hypothetical protein JJU33_02875 [Phycisphaerales bacterium]|nr:hypothetical protein [Phycisphaerales bacterium]